MAMHRAFPPKLGEVDPRAPHARRSSTWLFGIVSSLWFALLVILSHASGGDVLGWSVDGVGLMIAYYYGQTGFACVIYYRRYIFKSVKNFFFVGLLPLIGGLSLAFIFIWSLKDMTHADYTDPPSSWLGVSPVLWIGLGTLLAGIPLMYSGTPTTTRSSGRSPTRSTAGPRRRAARHCRRSSAKDAPR